MLFAHLALFPQERIGLLMDNVYKEVNMQDVSVLKWHDNNTQDVSFRIFYIFGIGSWFRRRYAKTPLKLLYCIVKR